LSKRSNSEIETEIFALADSVWAVSVSRHFVQTMKSYRNLAR